MRQWRITLLLVAAGVLATIAGCSAVRLEQARKLARASEPFNVTPVNATARLLVIGDSTGVGTGATSNVYSVAGRIAADHPRLTVVNVAEDGARFQDLPRQLAGAPGETYDIVLIQAGGNDVIRLTSESALRAEIESVLALAARRGKVVIVMPSGNVGNSAFFYPPLAGVMTSRSRILHGLVRVAASNAAAVYVNLFNKRDNDPFVREPERLHSADGLHPSDDGYGLWYEELKAQALLQNRIP